MTDRAILLSLAAAIIVIVSEATQKSLPSGYWRNWYVFLPLAILINWVLYHLLQDSPSLPAAFVLFTAATWTLRPLVSLWLGHPPKSARPSGKAGASGWTRGCRPRRSRWSGAFSTVQACTTQRHSGSLGESSSRAGWRTAPGRRRCLRRCRRAYRAWPQTATPGAAPTAATPAVDGR